MTPEIWREMFRNWGKNLKRKHDDNVSEYKKKKLLKEKKKKEEDTRQPKLF